MKASEAIKILEALDPSHEVTLTIGSPKQYNFPQNPLWNQPQPMWLKDNTTGTPASPPYILPRVTCKYKH